MPSVTGRNTAQSFRTAIDRIEAVSRRLRNVTIENLSYKDCIKRYDSEGSFFYIDCPYWSREGYYGDSFNLEDHYKLSDLLHNIKGLCMVSHYDNPVYNELYHGWHRFEYESFKGSHKAERNTEKPKTVEVLYCNYEPIQKQINIFKNK